MLRHINFLPTYILETFFYKIVIPSVLYGIVIWGSGPKFKDMEMIHIRADRLIHKLPNSFKDSDILSLNVVLNRPETELGRRSFVHRSAITWNALPDNLKDLPNSSIFIYNLKQSKQTIMNINFCKGGNDIYNMKPDFYCY